MIPGHIELYRSEFAGLAFSFRVNPDSCGNHEHYEQYIRFSALTDHKCGRGTTFVFLSEDDKKLLGYITLRANSYIKTVDDKPEGDPAMEIFELAVSADVEHNGLGKTLVEYAITLASDIKAQAMGIRYVVVCADKEAVGFYEKIGFGRVADYGDIPRDHWNDNCDPMFLGLPES